jgi:Asp-tRNA(Asn)/Glu-tRNA(Gln) amidotransferase A subunit family amidase
MTEPLPPPCPTGAEAVALIQSGALSAEDLARACLARIAAREPAVRAWAWLDPPAVLREARELDRQPVKRPLHGLPVGVKDVFATRDMPTEHNSPLYRGLRPGFDAAAIATLRAAGALIFGKTETVEFAAGGRLPPTRHPLDPTRTAGGTSSGSAAAVGDGHVPVALGTQTAGSTIRPASFNGVFALKPSWGVVSREGFRACAQSLDTVTWFGRTVADLALLADAFAIADDEAPAPVAPAALRIALCRSPAWPLAEPATRAALLEAAARFAAAGAEVVELELPEAFAPLRELQDVVMNGEARAAFLGEYRTSPGLLHEDFHAKVENRQGITPAALCAAYDAAAACRRQFDELAGGFDAVLTPSARGEAPSGLGSTGDPAFNRMWTLLHVPCVNLPGLSGPAGLPVGVTLTGPRYSDRKLLAVAEAVAPLLA